jgi:hypothetical protein
VGFGIDVARRRGGRGRGFYLFGDGLGEFFGERIGLSLVTVVALGPDVSVGGSVDQLHRDVDAVCGALDGAFEDAVDAELAGDVTHRTIDTFVLHDRGAGDDAQGAILGQRGDELVGHAVGEIVLRPVAGKIFEGKNAEGSDGCGGRQSAVVLDDTYDGCAREQQDHNRCEPAPSEEA